MGPDLSDLSLSIASWDPAYGSAVDFRELDESDQQIIDDSVEMNSLDWKPLNGDIAAAPQNILLRRDLKSIRRILWYRNRRYGLLLVPEQFVGIEKSMRQSL